MEKHRISFISFRYFSLWGVVFSRITNLELSWFYSILCDISSWVAVAWRISYCTWLRLRLRYLNQFWSMHNWSFMSLCNVTWYKFTWSVRWCISTNDAAIKPHITTMFCTALYISHEQHRKYVQRGFGECPRMLCRGQPVLPVSTGTDMLCYRLTYSLFIYMIIVTDT